MEDPKQQLLDELRERYGADTVLVDKPQGLFLFGRPTPIVFERYFVAIEQAKEKKVSKLSAFQQLCRDCLVYPLLENGKPDLGKLNTLFTALPGLPLTVGGELSDLAGAGESHTGKL